MRTLQKKGVMRDQNRNREYNGAFATQACMNKKRKIEQFCSQRLIETMIENVGERNEFESLMVLLW